MLNWRIVITIRSRNDQAQFSGNNDCSYRLLVSCKGRSRRWCLTLADDRLRSGIPVPQQNSAIGTSRCYVTIRRDVAFAAWQTRDNSIMAEHYLYNFCWKREMIFLLNFFVIFIFRESTNLITSFGREYTEAVVPETTSNQESAVHSGDEAITSYLKLLTEIVTQVATQGGIRTVRCLSCNNN